jgi:hypothetical protein
MRADLALYLGARALGQSGHNLFLATLLIIAGTGEHAAAGMGAVMVVSTVAAIALGIPGGAVADRLGPARGFAVGGGLRAVIIALLLVVPISPGLLVAMAFVYGAFSQVHNPAEMALVKVLDGEAAGRTHSLLVAFQYAGQAMGYLVLAPALYLTGGIHLALAGALLLVLAKTGLAALLAMRVAAQPPSVHRGAFGGLRETLSVFAHSELARDGLAVQAIKSLVAQVILVAFPLYVKHDLSLGTEGVAYLLGAGIVGAALGLLWAATGLTSEGLLRAMRISTLGMAVAVFALAALDYGVTAAFAYSQVPPLVRFEAALNTTAVVAMPVAFLVGASLSVSMVSSRAAMTSAAPVGVQARVFAVQATVSDALVIIPLLFAGVLAELLGARTTLAALGTLCAVTWLLMWHPWFQLPYLARRAAVRA